MANALRAAGPRLMHLHANESHRGIPGRGALDWIAVRNALRDINYTGALVIETFDSTVPDVAVPGRMWRPLAPSADALAREGIGFLRTTMLTECTDR